MEICTLLSMYCSENLYHGVEITENFFKSAITASIYYCEPIIVEVPYTVEESYNCYDSNPVILSAILKISKKILKMNDKSVDFFTSSETRYSVRIIPFTLECTSIYPIDGCMYLHNSHPMYLLSSIFKRV